MKNINWKNIVVIIAVLIFCLSYCVAKFEEKAAEFSIIEENYR